MPFVDGLFGVYPRMSNCTNVCLRRGMVTMGQCFQLSNLLAVFYMFIFRGNLNMFEKYVYRVNILKIRRCDVFIFIVKINIIVDFCLFGTIYCIQL